jgi:hypothetical protein
VKFDEYLLTRDIAIERPKKNTHKSPQERKPNLEYRNGPKFPRSGKNDTESVRELVRFVRGFRWCCEGIKCVPETYENKMRVSREWNGFGKRKIKFEVEEDEINSVPANPITSNVALHSQASTSTRGPRSLSLPNSFCLPFSISLSSFSLGVPCCKD